MQSHSPVHLSKTDSCFYHPGSLLFNVSCIQECTFEVSPYLRYSVSLWENGELLELPTLACPSHPTAHPPIALTSASSSPASLPQASPSYCQVLLTYCGAYQFGCPEPTWTLYSLNMSQALSSFIAWGDHCPPSSPLLSLLGFSSCVQCSAGFSSPHHSHHPRAIPSHLPSVQPLRSTIGLDNHLPCLLSQHSPASCVFLLSPGGCPSSFPSLIWWVSCS